MFATTSDSNATHRHFCRLKFLVIDYGMVHAEQQEGGFVWRATKQEERHGALREGKQASGVVKVKVKVKAS